MARPRIDPALIPAFPNLEFEEAFWAKGCRLVAGVDEAGRGAIAGPIFAAAVILPAEENDAVRRLLGVVRDSKQMTWLQREEVAALVKAAALAWAVYSIEAAVIDDWGMARAGRAVLQGAAEALNPQPGGLLLDYFKLPDCQWPQECLVKGDQRSLSIACASVIAKTARDSHMRALDVVHPGYGFASNKGYGCSSHFQAVHTLGLCRQHRRSFLHALLQPALFGPD